MTEHEIRHYRVVWHENSMQFAHWWHEMIADGALFVNRMQSERIFTTYTRKLNCASRKASITQRTIYK